MDKYIIDDRIFSVKFSCDLGKCKGACCTLKGAGGAPVLDDEISLIRSNLKFAKRYLSEVNINCIESDGFFEGSPGDYSIRSVNDKECVFSFYEDDIAKCSFQKAYNNNETDFRKPISCHLFPVRISGVKRNIIRYEELSECEDALIKGAEENISVFEFVRESLIREYGNEFYEDLKMRYLK